MKLTPFSFNFILTLKVDLDPTYLIQTIFIFVSIVKASLKAVRLYVWIFLTLALKISKP